MWYGAALPKVVESSSMRRTLLLIVMVVVALGAVPAGAGPNREARGPRQFRMFGGGFGQRILEPWGEQSMKRLVHEAIEEALKLEIALARLQTPRRVALLHYAPIRGTVEGEPLEIYPFLGCSRLEEPLNRYRVAAVVHGHAHHGRPEGRTSGGVPVYNVSLPLLRRCFPDRPPYRLLEVAPRTPAQG